MYNFVSYKKYMCVCIYIYVLGVGVHCYDYLPFYNGELLLRLPVRSDEQTLSFESRPDREGDRKDNG